MSPFVLFFVNLIFNHINVLFLLFSLSSITLGQWMTIECKYTEEMHRFSRKQWIPVRKDRKKCMKMSEIDKNVNISWLCFSLDYLGLALREMWKIKEKYFIFTKIDPTKTKFRFFSLINRSCAHVNMCFVHVWVIMKYDKKYFFFIVWLCRVHT